VTRTSGPEGRSGATRGRGSVYDVLRQSILRGDIGPGAPLTESVLAATYDVSRTPVREALLRLEQDGVVRRTDRGLVVRERSPEEILDIYETRIVLEQTVARVAAERRTSMDLLTLRKHAQLSNHASPENVAQVVDTNRDFHRSIWRASRNEPLTDVLQRLELHVARYPATTLSHPGRLEQANRQHDEIVAAIERRDGDTAAEIAAQHFRDARDIRLELWEKDLS
jgi:DNA-binding GntR family transcriptional regulator